MCLGTLQRAKKRATQTEESIPKQQIHLDERCGCGGLEQLHVEDVYGWSESECTLQMHRTIREVKDFNALFLNIYTSDI